MRKYGNLDCNQRNSILEASEAGFHRCCVSYATVGTQTDEPMDLSEEKLQDLYFVVYICLLFKYWKKKKNNLSSQQACFVISYSSGDLKNALYFIVSSTVLQFSMKEAHAEGRNTHTFNNTRRCRPK